MHFCNQKHTRYLGSDATKLNLKERLIVENLLKMTKRELFEKIVKEINSKEHELELFKTGVFSRLEYDIEKILNVENVYVWREDVPDNRKAQVIEIKFKEKDFILKMPILVTCKNEKVGGKWENYIKVMLKKIELNHVEIDEVSLDKTIEQLIEENFALINKIISEFEQKLEDLPMIINSIINLMKKGDDIPCDLESEITSLFTEYNTYKQACEEVL